MDLPTKDELLKTGLKPLEHEDCLICHEPMENPVRVPCEGKHAFCKECITTWLKRPAVTTCPMCRQKLCSAHDENEDDRRGSLGTLLHRVQLDNAFRASGLGFYLFPDETNNPRFEDAIDIFHDDIQLNLDHLPTLVPLAKATLVRMPQRLQDHYIRVDAGAVGACLVIMGNVIEKRIPRGYRHYNDRHRRVWGEMVHAIWQLVSPWHGDILVGRNLFFAIMERLIDLTRDDALPFFFGTKREDLTYLIWFLCLHGGMPMSEARAQIEIDVDRSPGPFRLPSVGSELAVLHAERFTAQAFDSEAEVRLQWNPRDTDGEA